MKLWRLIPCVVLVIAADSAAAQEQPLGRLFFTPAQRSSLDVARSQRALTTLATEKTEETVAATPVPQTITYDGMVRRSDGKTTVFINSRPVNDKDPVGGGTIVGRVRPDGGVTLQVPQSGRSIDLKPGQRIELLSGTIEEAHSRKPAAPEPKLAAKPAAEAKAAKPASQERSQEERDREEQQRKLEEAVRALQDAAAVKPGTSPVPPQQEPPR